MANYLIIVEISRNAIYIRDLLYNTTCNIWIAYIIAREVCITTDSAINGHV